MNKVFILSTVFLTLTACEPTVLYTKDAQDFANRLETQKDPIEVIEAYKVYSRLCILKHKYDHVPSVEACIKKKALTDPNVLISCVPTNRYNNDPDRLNYNSDECILYRRSDAFYESKVDYFDYKRFLGENSVIKTDDAFLNLVEMYNIIETCGADGEYTTTEIQACRDEKKNKIRMFATKILSCKELLDDKYTNKLKSEGTWYKWAIDHSTDNSENKALADYFQAAGAFWATYYFRNTQPAPVLSPAVAKKRVAQSIEDFGKQNYCTTKDWETEIKKLGFKM